MDPLSAATSVIGVIVAIGQTTSAAMAFMRAVRSARKDMLDVKRQLSALQTVLEILKDDLVDSSSMGPLPATFFQQITNVAANSNGVVLKIGDCLRRQDSSVTRWVMSGKKEVAGLCAQLEIHKSTLDLTLDLISTIIVNQIKSDTGQILKDTSVLRQDTSSIKVDLSHILEEIGSLQTQLRDLRQEHAPNIVLERYLDGLRIDTTSVLEEFEPNPDDIAVEDTATPFEDTVGEHRPNSPRDRSRDSPTMASIMLTNSLGFRFPVPYEACKTWTDINEIIRQSYGHGVVRQIMDGEYDLVGPGGETIPPDLWQQLIKPGWDVTVVLWPSVVLWPRMKPLKLLDPLGHIHEFPFYRCETWEGMEDLLLQIFKDRPHWLEISDLIDPNGNKITRDQWERSVRPGWRVTMVHKRTIT